MINTLDFAKQNQNKFLDELTEFLRIPSISTDSNYSKQVKECAIWLSNHLEKIGMENVEIIETVKHPIVYAESKIDSTRPTVMIYGHYDVQPPDPVAEWNTNPFDPVIRDGSIYARGASDDKGQLFAIVKAIESILKTDNEFGCNIKLVFEGEEEVGSVNLIETIRNESEKFAADTVLICDSSMFSEHSPAITLSVRGIVYTELILENSNHDLHSGVYGGAVENPLHTLSKLIAGFHDDDNKITVKGFYDDVTKLSMEEKEEVKLIPFDEKEFLNSVGLSASKTEKDYSIYEARTVRPTLDVNGIWGGYSGEGAKTVIPSRVGAKISCRLVANQEPEKIFRLLKDHVETKLPKSLKKTFKLITVANPVIVNHNNNGLIAFARALEDSFNSKPYYLRGDGSLPIVSEFKKLITPYIIITGFGLASDSVHAPNEKISLFRFRKGIKTIIQFLISYN